MTPVAEDDGGGLNSPTTNSTSISTTTTTTDEDQQQVKKKMDDSFKLTQDASKIVRAIKRLNVPSNSSVVETIDSENGKRGIIRLKQGVHLSYSVDLVEDGDGKTVPQKMDDKENATCVSAGERKSVKLNQVIQNCETNNKVCKTTSTMTMAVVCKDGGGGGESEGDKEPCQEDDVEEWQIVDEVHTDSSTSSDRSLIENQTSKSSISSSSSTTSTTTSLATVVPNSVKEVTARLVNDASATCLQKHQSSIKPNDKIETESPLFDANSNEEAMQWGVSKVVDDILENLPNIDNDFDVSEKSNSRKTPIEEGRQRLISSLESVQSNKMAADGCCSVVGGRGGAKRKSESDGEDKSLVVKKVRLDSDAKSEESPIKSPMETVSKMSKQLTKRDLEEFIAKEIVAFLSDEHRNEIAELKARIVKLEKAKDYWKRQATAIQKQHVEDDIAIQRLSQSLKRTGALPPTKIVTRSVGLQVQTQVPSVLRCNRMVPSELALADVKKSTPTATTTTTTTVRGASNTTTTNTPTPPQLSTMKLKSSSMPAPKPNVSLLSISKPPQAGYQSPVSKPAILMSPRPRLSPVTSLPNPNISILTQQPSTSAQNSTSATTNAKLPPSVSVSILQQRITNPPGPSSAPPNLMVTPVSMPMSIVPKVASVIPPQSSPARTILEVKRGLPVVVVEDGKVSSTNVGKSDTQPNAHTLNLTRAALRIFRRFMTSVGEKRELVDLPPSDLSRCLTNFFAYAKKKDGSEYGAHTLTCIFDSIDRHLRSSNYSVSIKRDETFYNAREQLRQRRRQLQRKKKSTRSTVSSTKVRHKLSMSVEEEIVQDIKFLSDWIRGSPNFDSRELFQLSTSTLNTYLAQFFILIYRDKRDALLTPVRLKKLYDNIDVYLSNHGYPMSIKRESHFRHSMECFSFKEKLLRGISLSNTELKNEAEKECTSFLEDVRKVATGWSTKDVKEKTENGDVNDMSTSLFEPDISLVEDDKEIDLEMNNIDDSSTSRMVSDVDVFNKFLSTNLNEKNQIEKIIPTKLDRLLAQFFLVSRRIDGSEHDVSDLMRMHNNIHCYLKERGYPLSIKNDIQFAYSRLCVASKCNSLTQLHQLPDDVFRRQLRGLQLKGAVGNMDPIALICCLWCHFGRGFNLLTSTDHANLRWGDVELQSTNGEEYLEYTGSVSNILTGKNNRLSTYKLYSVDKEEEICPVEAFKVYAKNRPVSKLHDRFYLRVASPPSHLWFTDKALTERHVEQVQQYVRVVLDKVKIGSADIELSELKSSLLDKLLQEEEPVIECRQVSTLSNTKEKKMSDQRVKEVFVAGGHAPNTIIKTMHDVNVFRDWLTTLGKSRDFSSFPTDVLNRLLLDFFSNLKKRDGSEYEPNSLCSIYFSIDRYLRVVKYPVNIKSDIAFQQCRTFFQEKRREFDADRDSTPQHVVQRRQVDISFADEDIDNLRKQGFLGLHNPDAMLLALWYMNTVLLGIHSQRAQLHMLWGDFDLKSDPDGRMFVEYHQHATKAKLISCPPNGIATFLNKRPSKIYENGDHVDSCPVRLFKEFQKRRPAFTLNSDSRFYLCPGVDEHDSGIWFRSVPIGRNKLGAIPSTIWSLIRRADVKPTISNLKRPLMKQPKDNLSMSLIPIFPSPPVVKKSESSTRVLRVFSTPISTQNVVLFPVVSTATAAVTSNVASSPANGVQIIPLM